jgi:hypothetical protein
MFQGKTWVFAGDDAEKVDDSQSLFALLHLFFTLQ